MGTAGGGGGPAGASTGGATLSGGSLGASSGGLANQEHQAIPREQANAIDSCTCAAAACHANSGARCCRAGGAAHGHAVHAVGGHNPELPPGLCDAPQVLSTPGRGRVVGGVERLQRGTHRAGGATAREGVRRERVQRRRRRRAGRRRLRHIRSTAAKQRQKDRKQQQQRCAAATLRHATHRAPTRQLARVRHSQALQQHAVLSPSAWPQGVRCALRRLAGRIARRRGRIARPPAACVVRGARSPRAL